MPKFAGFVPAQQNSGMTRITALITRGAGIKMAARLWFFLFDLFIEEFERHGTVGGGGAGAQGRGE